MVLPVAQTLARLVGEQGADVAEELHIRALITMYTDVVSSVTDSLRVVVTVPHERHYERRNPIIRGLFDAVIAAMHDKNIDMR